MNKVISKVTASYSGLNFLLKIIASKFIVNPYTVAPLDGMDIEMKTKNSPDSMSL